MLIGAHVSQAGGLPKAIERGAEPGAHAIQIFNQSPRMWRPTAYDDDDFAAFREAISPSPINAVLIHAVYLINCATEDAEIRQKSHASLIQSLRVGAGIGATGVVLHPGSAKQGDVGKAIKRAGKVIAQGARRPRAASCTWRTRRAPAARSGARSRSWRRCSRPPAAARGSASAWTHATCSPPGTTSARSTASTQTIDEFDAPSGSTGCGRCTERLADAAGLQSRPSRGIGKGEIGDAAARRSCPSRGSTHCRACSRPRPTIAQVELCHRARRRGQAARKRAGGAARAAGARKRKVG